MSNDPFGNNPYQSPMGVPNSGLDSRSAALAKVQAPAMGLMVVSAVSIVVRLVMLLMSLMGVGMMAAAADNNANQGLAIGQMAGGLVGSIIGIAINGVTLFAGLKMKSLEQYGLVMTGVVLALIPCCSPCVFVGIPFGIWALVVLNDPIVKASFQK